MTKTRNKKYSTISAGAVLAAVPFLLQGCGGSGGSTASPAITNLQTGISSAQTTLQQNVPHITDLNKTAFNWMPRLYHGVQGFLFPEALATSLGSLSGFWTNASDATNLYDGGGSYSGSAFESPQNWMGQELDPSFLNSNGATTTPFGRVATDFMIVCVIGASQQQNSTLSAAMDSDNLLKAGTYSFPMNFSSASGSSFMGCSIPPSVQNLSSMGNPTLQIVVSNASPSTTYTKEYQMSWSGGTGHNPPNNTVFLKVDTTNQVLNMGIVEQNCSGCTPQWGIDRSLLSVTKNVADFEYVAQNYASGTNATTQDGFEMYRFHIDTGNNVGYVFGNYGAFNDASTLEAYTRYSLAAKPNNLNSVAVSMAIVQSTTSTSSPTSANAGDACVSASNGNVTTDASLTCDVTGVDISSTLVAEKTNANHTSTASSYTQTYALTATTTIPWTTFDTNTSTGFFGIPAP